MLALNKNRLRDLWNGLRGIPVEWNLGESRKLVAEINRIERENDSDQKLRKAADELATRARGGAALDDLLVETFALVRETAWRRIGLRPFDVQVLAGIALHQGRVVEMGTGEGKTLAAVLPAVLNGLTGKGVHILTFNDYLARRDAAWMGPVFEFLGLSVGCIQEGMPPEERRAAYASDITYATAKEAGFDYLRDHLVNSEDDLVHRAMHFAVIDEADSILVDEARVPLVIAGRTTGDRTGLPELAEVVQGLREGLDFELDEGKRNLVLTDGGAKRIEDRLGGCNLYAPENLDLLTAVNLALQAEYQLRRDVDYIVRGGKVEIVDEFTGRVVENRHWPDGLQAAVEAKEKVHQGAGGSILSSITLQHFIRLYPKIGGMTATARPAADELNQFYGLKTSVIPPNRPCVRRDLPDLVFTRREAKIASLTDEIEGWHSLGRPILIGTASIEESEHLSAALLGRGISCRVLNAKNDEMEAAVIARAGCLGAVTVSTNMAGRGTDIKLGGEKEKDRERVVALGGLHVIGTNRHESLRVDRQLRGRAGRQGDPGSSRFFVSLEDPLVREHGIDRLIPRPIREERGSRPVDHPLAAREIARGQRIVEGRNFEIRRTLWKYSYLLEKQRQIVSARRGEVLRDGGLPDHLGPQIQQQCPRLRSKLDEETWKTLSRTIVLHWIDRCWMDHLALVADVREGIHLESVGGRSPLYEFQKFINEEFQRLNLKIEEGILNSFRDLPASPEHIDLERMGIRGPSSTWTYLINDNQFGFWVSLLHGGNIGATAVAAGVYGPLYLLMALAGRFFRKKVK